VVALRASLFGWKVTKTRDVIRIIVEVQSNFKAEIRRNCNLTRSGQKPDFWTFCDHNKGIG
jgi:hypothetical protein